MSKTDRSTNEDSGGNTEFDIQEHHRQSAEMFASTLDPEHLAQHKAYVDGLAKEHEVSAASEQSWTEPEVLTGPPVLPGPMPATDTLLRIPEQHDAPTDSNQLAQDFVLHGGGPGNWLRVLDDETWYRWTAAGWVRDRKAAALTARLQEWGAVRFYAPSKGADSRIRMRQDRIRGGAQGLARQVAAVLPAYRGMAIHQSDFDRSPNLVGLPDGRCHDLDTGESRAQVPDDYLMRRTPVTPAPVEGSVWERIIMHVYPEGDRRCAFQVYMGSMLWGRPVTRTILVVPGVTGGGKTTMLKLIALALGEYATQMKADTVTTKGTAGIGFEIDNANALLRGRRVVLMSELARNRKLDPARINELTGGDTLLSRRKSGDLLETPATHSIVLAMNDLPNIDVHDSPETAKALFQRLRPFPVRQPMGSGLGAEAQRAMRDPRELGAVLQWLLEGAAMFREDGERPLPGSVRVDLQDWWSDLSWGDNPRHFDT